MALTTKSGTVVLNNEPMTGGYAHGGEVRHISNDFGSHTAVCGKELEYTVQLQSMDIATCKRCLKIAGVVPPVTHLPASDVTNAYYILMYDTGIGMQQVAETGIFHSKTQARNFITYNGHLLINDQREKVDPSTVRVFAVTEA